MKEDKQDPAAFNYLNLVHHNELAEMRKTLRSQFSFRNVRIIRSGQYWAYSYQDAFYECFNLLYSFFHYSEIPFSFVFRLIDYFLSSYQFDFKKEV